MTLKIENILSNIASILIWVGILVVGYYNNNPSIVTIASVACLAGLMLSKGVGFYFNNEIRQLDLAISREWSYLNVIRLKTEKNESIDSELLKQAKDASTEADQIYKNIYGFYRPATAIRSSTTLSGNK
jgi:hypothetical protein